MKQNAHDQGFQKPLNVRQKDGATDFSGQLGDALAGGLTNGVVVGLSAPDGRGVVEKRFTLTPSIAFIF